MSQELKELLFKDLCSRLPYDTKVYCQNEIDWFDDEIGTAIISACINDEYIVKPYLFPISSMNEKQREEYLSTGARVEVCGIENVWIPGLETFDWLNKNHFDYRGLIKMGLAIDATSLNVYC